MRSPFSRTNIWHYLLKPSPHLSASEQIKANNLASFLLAVVGVGLLINIFTLLFFPAEAQIVDARISLPFAALMLIPFILSRTRHYRLGNFVFVGWLMVAVYLIAFVSEVNYLFYLLVPIFAASVLLSIRATFFMIVLNILFLSLLPMVLEVITAEDTMQVSAFIIYLSFMLIVAAWYRSQAENRHHSELEQRVAERTGELLAANRFLKQEITEREMAEAALRQARQVSETLHEANLALTRSLDLDIVLKTLLDYLFRLVPYDSGNVMLCRDKRRVEIAAVCGYEPWLDPRRLHHLVFDLAEFPTLQNLVHGEQSMLVPDVNLHADWRLHQDTQASYIKSWMGVPLIAGGEVIGLYSLDKTETNFFTEAHLQLAETLAAQAAVAIQNASLFAQVHDGREQLRQLTQQVVTVQEEERRRVSRELHDEAGQALTAMKFSLAMLLTRVPGNGSLANKETDIRHHVKAAIALCETTMSQIRNLAHDLRPAALDDLGLNPALGGFCVDFAERTSLPITYQGVDAPLLPEAANITLYRFLQEALTNVAKHAQATRIEVTLWLDEAWVNLSVLDDGRGFTVHQEDSGYGRVPGIGLSGMRERLQLVGGRLQLQQRPEGGVCLTACVPW